MEPTTDEELMERVAAGDVRAFEAIYHRHHRQAYALATHIAGRAGSAEEATQDAFFSLWRGAAGFDPERASLHAWLLGIVRNRSIDSLRRERHRARYQETTEDAADRIEAPERTEERVFAMQEYDRARHLVAELPPEQREVIDLAYIAEYSQREIAASVGVPLGTVKSRTRLALVKLRRAAAYESAPAGTA